MQPEQIQGSFNREKPCVRAGQQAEVSLGAASGGRGGGRRCQQQGTKRLVRHQSRVTLANNAPMVLC